MKKILVLLSLLCLIIILNNCKKAEIPGNRDYDPTISVAQIVKINTTEIGGDGLLLKSFRDDDSPLYKGSFNTVVSKEGEQLLAITDSKNELRALTLSTPSSSASDVMPIDAHATTVSVVFISPGILSTDPKEAKDVIDKIEKLTSFSPLESYLLSNLKSKSLKDIVSNSSYDSLLNHCVTEYYQKYSLTAKKSSKGIQVFKNFITFNQISQKKIEIKNEAYRYVSVVERDISNDHSLLNQKIHIPNMKGAIPWGWGSLFTNTMMDPTVKVIDYLPVDNSSISEFWVLGIGQPTQEDVPQAIRSLNRPIVETLLYYGAFPIIDLVSGTNTFINYLDSDIADLIRNGKLDIAMYKAASAETKPQFVIALIDDTFTIIGTLASMSSSPIATGAAYVVATFASAFSSFNFGAFAGSLCWCDNYTKFSLLAYNQPPMFPVLSDPTTNSVNIETPVSFHWTIPTLAETYDFQISKSPTFNSIAFEVNRETANGIQVNALEKGTKYYWHVRACNNYGCSLWTGTWTFTTKGSPPSASFTYSPKPAIVDQSVQFTNLSSIDATSWEWDFGDNSKSTLKNPSHSYVTPGTFTVGLTAYNSFGWGTAAGNITVNASVTPAPPTVTTTSISGITQTTATSGGNVTSIGSSDVIVRGVCWGTASNPTTTDNVTTDGAGIGSFTSSITGLTVGTIYHVRAYAINSAGIGYGVDRTFTTLITLSWVIYDQFTDNTLNSGLWRSVIGWNGRVLETNNQLQVWGHTGASTGSGRAQTVSSATGWRFEIIEEYINGFYGGQGWHIYAYDNPTSTRIELANHISVGGSVANLGDIVGAYEIVLDNNTFTVWRDGSILRTVSADGKPDYALEFTSDDVAGGGQTHLFIDNVWIH